MWTNNFWNKRLYLKFMKAYIWVKNESVVTQSCPILRNPVDWLLCPWNSLGKDTGVGTPSPRDLPNPGIKLGSPALQTDYLI